MASAFNDLGTTFGDRPKIFCLEAGAADQATINIRQCDELTGIFGFHGTAVQHTDSSSLVVT